MKPVREVMARWRRENHLVEAAAVQLSANVVVCVRAERDPTENLRPSRLLYRWKRLLEHLVPRPGVAGRPVEPWMLGIGDQDKESGVASRCSRADSLDQRWGG